MVLADVEDWKVLEAPLREIFEKVLYTPQTELLFEIERGDVEHFYNYKHAIRKSLLIISPIDAPHETGTFLREILSPEVQDAIRQDKSAVSWKKDIWANDQLLMMVSGKDIDAVSDNLWMSSDELFAALETAVLGSIRERVYSFGERENVTQELAQKYGWSVKVPFGYRILEAYPDSGFVALAKDNPNRWLSVYWEDGIHPDQITEDWCIQKRDEITSRFFGGDRIVPGDVQIVQKEFAGQLAVVLQGLWENKKDWKGGPFKSYAFLDIDQNRFFFIDMGLYAPNKQKLPYIRQIDLIARTFQIHQPGSLENVMAITPQ
ncbi:MAG: hypothetical protein ACI8V2_000943 [Candidatus Latescibacterota bacterium]|jgi:hypothetical protein